MKYLHIIFSSIVLLLISSCAVDNLELSTGRVDDSDEITVLGHVTRFDDYDVETRSAKQGNEGKITSFAMAIFKVENGEATDCVHYEYHENQSQLLFTINRNDENNVPLYDAGQPYVIYVFANMPGMGKFSSDYSLDDMLAQSYAVQDLNIPTDGFPMIGSLGDNFSDNQDGQIFYMISGKAEHEGKPAVGDEAKTTLNIPLKALYAKINFEIEVRPDQIIEGYPPKFELHSYKIVNVPKSIDFKNSSNPDTDATIGVLDTITVETGNVTASGANKITFSFYLPENLVEPYKTWDEFEYPFGKGSSIREQDMKYRQRYKVLLLDENNDKQPDRIATNIILSGTFQDHQDHSLKVDYTIYLGKDAFGDFNIERNGEYNNVVTIRGILNSDDNQDNYISLDHRVNVEHTQPAIISLRREVLLDSHFEIRPLRIKKNAAINGPTHVKVQVVDPDITNWMRIERSYGTGNQQDPLNSNIYIINDTKNVAANGKRKYFTNNLISGLNAKDTDYSLVDSYSLIVPLEDNNPQCVWIYVDECLDSGDDVRSGVIRLNYLQINDQGEYEEINNSQYPEIDYSIIQRKLFHVKGNSGKEYDIEFHEEFLHNYDAEDTFSQTEEEGMEWGLNGIQLSYDHEALYFKAKTGDWANGIVDYFTGEVPAYYDFYTKKHDESKMADPKQVTLHEYEGYNFCKEIIDDINGFDDRDIDPTNDIDILALNQKPKSAVEYCYNKNKRNIAGEVEDMQWYLPAIDEIEDIVTSEYTSGGATFKTYARFNEFQDKFYWSSQPAYIQNYAHMRWTFIFIPLDYWGAFYYDDIGNTLYDINNKTDRVNVGSARATKVKYEAGVYSEISSHTDGYYSYYNASSESENEKYQYTGTFNGVTVGEIIRAEGNKPRNSMARVRCVRKKATTATE